MCVICPKIKHIKKVSVCLYWHDQDLKCIRTVHGVHCHTYMSSDCYVDPQNLKQLTGCGLKSAKVFSHIITLCHTIPVLYTHPPFWTLCTPHVYCILTEIQTETMGWTRVVSNCEVVLIFMLKVYRVVQYRRLWDL